MEDAGSLSPSLDLTSFGPSAFFTDIIDGGHIVSVLFALIFLWWLIYSIVAGYHWLRFGRDSWIAVPAVAAHVFVSGAILLFMTSGLR